MSTKINSLEYLGSINLARIVEDPEAVVARGSNAAYDINRLWFTPLLPKDCPVMVTIVPNPPRIKEEMEQYGGNGVVDFDVKGPAVGSAWYVISIERTDFGPSVSIYIPENAPEEGANIVRAAWKAGQ